MKVKFNIINLRWLAPYLLKKICIVSLIALIAPICAFSQGTRVNGTVFDDSGPLAGVAVMIKGTSQGMASDDNGEFSIVIPNDTVTLQFSYSGYRTEEVKVGQRKVIAVKMREETTELDEVTVVAFGVQKKESVIASITTINPADLKVPSSNLTTALAGRMAGMIAYQRNGEPGLDDAEFFIRGVTTFGYKKDPLILIDGNESTTKELSRMQPDDIANFSILKDATATALYGSRGANGVIMISTKSGKEGSAKIDFRYEEALSMPTRMVKLVDPIAYMNLHNEAVKTRDPLSPSMYSESKIQNTIAGGNPYVYPTTDWYDMLFKDYTNNHRLNFNASGGGSVAQYYLAGSVINDNGVLNVDKRNNFNSNVNLNRYMLRTNVNINITKTTQAIVRISGAFDDYSGPIDGGGDLFTKVVHTNPVLFPAYFEPDERHEFAKHILFGNAETGQYNNPYADMVKGYKQSTTAQMSAQFELTQKLDFITKGLSARAMFNTSRYSDYEVTRNYNPFFYRVSDYDKKTDKYTLLEINTGSEALSLSQSTPNVIATTYFESNLNWNRVFAEKHDLGALLVFTMRNELVSNVDEEHIEKSLPSRNMNLAGRFTYAYNSRYLFEGNFGYNGSERFAIKERFGFFPSAGIGWIISNEGFYGDNLKSVLSNLKLKATYGLSGNDAIGSPNERFFYLSKVQQSDERRSSFGTNGNGGSNSGVVINRYANEDITWETAEKMNLTAEIGLFKKLDLQIEYFRENRSNILMDRAYIPTTMGLTGETLKANVGESFSRGTDISLNFNHSFNAYTWLTAMGNFTYATSEYAVYEEPDYPGAPWKSHVGSSLGRIDGYIAERLFVDEEEIRNSPQQTGNYMAGDIKYKDLNGDGRFTDQDLAPIGYPSTPEIVYGFGVSAGWKQIDFSFFFQGLARESFSINAAATAPFNEGQYAMIQSYADSHWSEENRDIYALYPRLSATPIENNIHRSTWWLRDGSFLRLKSVELGYTLPEKFASKIYMNNLRVYFSGTNLLTFSKFKLWDPEMAENGLGYPVQRVFNLGIQLSF